MCLKSDCYKKFGFLSFLSFIKNENEGLPWWRSCWESACRWGRHRFVPRSGRIPHAAEQLGPWAMAAEPACLEPVLRNGRGHNSERPAYRKKKKKSMRSDFHLSLQPYLYHSLTATWLQSPWPSFYFLNVPKLFPSSYNVSCVWNAVSHIWERLPPLRSNITSSEWT